MKKLVFFISVLVMALLPSCYNSEDYSELQKQCDLLQRQKNALSDQVGRLSNVAISLESEISSLRKEKGIIDGNRIPEYLVTIKIKQGTFALDIGEWIKNEVNETTIVIPVSREFYNDLSIGMDLTDNFKMGSFIVDGDLSWLHMKVVKKEVK